MCRCMSLLLAGMIAIAGPEPAEADTRIGFANPLTGPYALSGHRNRVAVESAVHDLNRRGGVLGEEVQLVMADDACGLEQAVVAARELIAAGVGFVVGHMCSHASLLAAGLYETADILMISPDSTHPRLTEEGRANVFRLIGRDDQQGRLAADLLTSRWAGKNIALLHDGSTYGEGLAAEIRKHLGQRGVTEALYDFYVPGKRDYSTLIERLEKARIDVLYIGGYGRDAGLILRTARERGLSLPLVGGDGLGMDGFWAAAGAAGEGTIFSARPNVGRTPEATEVLTRFQERGLGTRTGGIGAYATVQVWAQAVERAGTSELGAVATMLRRGYFESILGPVAFDHKGDLEDAGWQWKVWRNGTHVPLSRNLPLRRSGSGAVGDAGEAARERSARRDARFRLSLDTGRLERPTRWMAHDGRVRAPSALLVSS